MRRIFTLSVLAGLLLFATSAQSANKVVVIPMGGSTVGNATAADVAQGKTFSSKEAGEGITGTLSYDSYCGGTSIGERAFKLNNVHSANINTGDIFQTTTAKIIIITGTSDPAPIYYGDDYASGMYDHAFYIAPEVLPEPVLGVKGIFYFVGTTGDMAYADYL